MLELLSAATKALGYAAALTAAGTVLAQATLTRSFEAAVPVPTGLIRGAGAILAITACCTAYLFVERLGGEADAAAIDAVFRSPLGAALGLQLAGGLLLLCVAARSIALVGAALVLVAFGVVGHSASTGLLGSGTVVLHVTGAAWWLGGLWILFLASGRIPSDAYAMLVGRFSSQAIWMVAILLGAALSTAALVLEFSVEPGRAYDRGLLAKLGIAAALLALAGVNKLVLSPKLAGDPQARPWLRRTILAELVLFATILSVTAWLTTYASPHEETHAGSDHAEISRVTGPIAIVEPWAPAMPGGVGTGAGYMTIVNNQSADDRLLAASSPWAEHVSLHASSTDSHIARMRELDGLRIPAHGRVTLETGVYHLMFTGLYAPFVAGDTVPLTLMFERAGRVGATLHVRPLGGQHGHGQ